MVFISFVVLLEGKADEVDGNRDQHEEKPESDRGGPAMPGPNDRVHLPELVLFDHSLLLV